jgi:hypothetical protein
VKQQTLLCRKTGAILQKTDDPLQNTSVPLQPCSERKVPASTHAAGRWQIPPNMALGNPSDKGPTWRKGACKDGRPSPAGGKLLVSSACIDHRT